MRDECIHRMGEFNAALPTIVFTVKARAGQELSAVKVTMDGEVVADHLDGSAFTLDPGSHQFTFEVAGQPPATDTIILHEGEKGRRETVVVGTAALPLTQSTATTAAGGGSGFRTLGLVVGGAGVVGLATGGIFGAMASSSWSTARSECPSHTGCTAQAIRDHDSASTLATVSTVGFIAGGILLAAGLTFYFTAPKDDAPRVGLEVAPGGLGMAGRF